jgi:hypothetical protein
MNFLEWLRLHKSAILATVVALQNAKVLTGIGAMLANIAVAAFVH